jgi:hypothetical protein
MKFKVMTKAQALSMCYSSDKRKRRREHRRNARELRKFGGGGTIAAVISWHLYQAQWLGR